MLERYTLKNGIPVFIVESHASPVVSIQAWVTRGSVHESAKVAGISHFLEHALFKGTRRRKVGQVAAEIESRGGEINAFTSFEETAFYCTLASRYFKEGLDIIADMMINPLFDKDEMAREREVIIEEIKRAHDSPAKMVSMNLWQTAFPNTPYGRPVLGFESTVRKINHTTLKSYFNQNYHTGSMAVFIVGDIEAKKALELAESKFAKAKRGPAKAPVVKFKAPTPSTVKIVAISRDLKECHVQISIPTSGIADPSIPAVDIMCSAIGSGESSRLYQRLVKETRLAMEAHFGLMATSHCGMASLHLLTAPENMNAAVKEAFEVLHKAGREGLDPVEIERVKSSLESDVISGKETVEGYARRLGYYYSEFGDPEYEGKYLQSLLAIDQARATDALNQLLQRRPVVSLAHPSDMKLDKKALTAAIGAKPAKPQPIGKTSGRPEKTTGLGVTYLTKPISTLPIISLRLLFPGGSREESKDKLGQGLLFGRLWTSGTRSFNALGIAQLLESLGASVHGFVGKNTCGLSVECLAKHWKEVKPILTECLLHPAFPEHEFATEKDLLLREILAEKDSPGQLCQHNFLTAMYGSHPYGRSPLGTKETISNMQISDLKQYYKDYIHRKRLVVSSVGSLASEPWNKELENILKELPADGKAAHPPIPIARSTELKIVAEKKEPLFQSHCLVGFLATSFQDPERYALKLLSSCLAGQGGRLFLELRDKQSLAYTVAPMNSDSPEPGVFGFYIGCSPEKLDRALSGIRTEIDKILDKPIDSKELDRAKEYWIGRFELELQRFGAQSMLYGLDEIYGLGFDHSYTVPEIIKRLTAKDIQTAAQKYLVPERAIISIVHNETLSEDQVRKAWNVERPKLVKSREKTASSSL